MDGLVRRLPLIAETGRGALFESVSPGMGAVDWVAAHRDEMEAALDAHGAVLLRGFATAGVDEFEQFVEAVATRLMDYLENTSPREVVRGHIRTSTEYPAAHRILLHNEHSYSAVCPRRLAMFCEIPPREGGRTPLADCRRVLARIDDSIRQRFEHRGWMYVRNFGDGLGPSWQEVFMTSDPQEVEEHCRRADIQYEWLGGDRLRTTQVRTATVVHPRTGEEVWFNHIAFWHVTSLEPTVRDVFLSDYAEADLPNQTYYGDGEPIEADVVEALREAYQQEEGRFTWRRGDLLLIDNVLVAHGREPFAGPRRVLFAMLDPTERESMAAESRGRSLRGRVPRANPLPRAEGREGEGQ